VRFLGVDLAWKDGNRSGVAMLEGPRFPLHLRESPHTLPRHSAVLTWIARRVARHRASVGIDAPLLGLGRGRRGGDNEISSAFGRFHASTHSPPRYPGLQAFTRALRAGYALDSFGPGWRPARGCPAIREVYPNALQVLLFELDRRPGLTIVKYKRQRFADKRAWVERGLRPFIDRCVTSMGGRHVVSEGPAWHSLLAARPRPSMSGVELKDIEDRWDAVLCAVGAALEFFEPGSMRFYPEGPRAWRRGYILAPALPIRRPPGGWDGARGRAGESPVSRSWAVSGGPGDRHGPAGAGRPSGDEARWPDPCCPRRR
jgi:predicted RNase H-like nuclease